MSNPPDRWIAVPLKTGATSDFILSEINNQPKPVTAAFVADCLDGWFLFLGFYGSQQ